MATTIYWYSGTGNALWAARELAKCLGESTLLPMAVPGRVHTEAERVGLVFPVHMWGVPRAVRAFLERLELPTDAYVFAAAVNGGQVSRTLVQLEELLGRRGLKLRAGASLVMPSNYIPWGGPGPVERQRALGRMAGKRLAALAEVIRGGQDAPLDRGPLWQRVLFTGLYHLTYPQVPKMDRHFWVDDRCKGCGNCALTCPASNITMVEGRPAWQHRCEQCLACIQWCPKTALQYGKKTPAYPRYHHPTVTAADLIRALDGTRESR